MNKITQIVTAFCFLVPVMSFGQLVNLGSLDSVTISPNPYYARIKNEKLYPGYIDIINMPGEAAEITIYTLSGEKIRTLNKKEGENHMLWFLRSEKNELIEGGIYMIRIKISGQEERIFKFYYDETYDGDPH